jgi:hypothetical protein
LATKATQINCILFSRSEHCEFASNSNGLKKNWTLGRERREKLSGGYNERERNNALRKIYKFANKDNSD